MSFFKITTNSNPSSPALNLVYLQRMPNPVWSIRFHCIGSVSIQNQWTEPHIYIYIYIS